MKTSILQNQVVHILSIVMVVLFVSSCTSTEKLINQGRYDEAISKSARKLQKKKQKLKYVLSLETAFRKATGADMDQVLDRYHSSRIADLEYILFAAYRIRSRQNQIKLFLPLEDDKQGYKATFEFVKIREIIDDVESRLTSRYMESGKSMMVQGQLGNKLAARDAYAYFVKADKISDHPDIVTYMDSAHHLGITRILVDLTNMSGDWMGYYINKYLDLNIYAMNGFWTSYYLEPPEDPIDYRIEAVIRSIDISPEKVNENRYRDLKEIEDGFDYVLDERGNVLKDSLGNDIKTPRKITVKAKIIEVFQEKDLWIQGDLDIFDRNGLLVDTKPFEVVERFEHYSSTFKGDRRALSNESKRKIGSNPVPFPSDEHMVMEALEKLSPAIHDQLSRMTIT